MNDSTEPLPYINEAQINAKQYSKSIEEHEKDPEKTFNQLITNGISIVLKKTVRAYHQKNFKID